MHKKVQLIAVLVAVFIAHAAFAAGQAAQSSAKPAAKATPAAAMASPQNKAVTSQGTAKAPSVAPKVAPAKKAEKVQPKQTAEKDNFEKIYDVVKTHFNKIQAPLNNAQLADIILHDVGFAIDATAKGLVWTPSTSANQIREDVNLITEGWSDAELNATGHGVAMTGLLGNLAWTQLPKEAQSDAWMPMAIGLKKAAIISKVAFDEMLKKEIKGYNGTLNGPNVSMPSGGMPIPSDPPPSAVDKAIASIEAKTGTKIGGTFCGRGWQNNVMGAHLGVTAAGLGMSSEGGGEGGQWGVVTNGCGGENGQGGLGLICGGGGKGGVMDNPGSQLQNLKNAKQNAADNYYKQQGILEGAEDRLDKAKTAEYKAYSDWGKQSPEYQKASKDLAQAQKDYDVQKEDADKTKAAYDKAIKEYNDAVKAAKEAEKQAGTTGTKDPGPDGGGLPPICAGAALGTAAYCGVGGDYAVMEYVYKEDIWDSGVGGGPMGEMSAEAYCEGLEKVNKNAPFSGAGDSKMAGSNCSAPGAEQSIVCICKIEQGVLTCKPADASPWNIDQQALYLPTFVKDPSPENWNEIEKKGGMDNKGQGF